MFNSITFAIALSALFLGEMSCAMSLASPDCAVVGCGVLGTSLCKQMLECPDLSDWKVTGVTKSNSRHESILAEVGQNERFSLLTSEESKGKKFQNVVFCAPPSGFEDYPAALEDCITNLWAGPSEGGSFVFTSSGGVYGFGQNKEVVNEGSTIADPEKNPRQGRLINAEKIVLENKGAVLRLAGLYTLDRGAHNFWLTSGKDVSGRSDGIINLLHYDDAAGAAMAALLAGPKVVSGNIYLISDGNPLTRKEICETSLQAKTYSGMGIPKFLGSDSDPIGKIYDGSASNKALKWDPRYSSFDSFMASQG